MTEKVGVVRYLLAHNADPNCWDDENISALHRAIQLLEVDPMKRDTVHQTLGLLLNHGADPSIKSLDEMGESALHVAARSGDVEIVMMLLGCGADPLSRDSQGRSVLFAALEAQVSESIIDHLVLRLLVRGVDVEQNDKNGRRPRPSPRHCCRSHLAT